MENFSFEIEVKVYSRKVQNYQNNRFEKSEEGMHSLRVCLYDVYLRNVYINCIVL